MVTVNPPYGARLYPPAGWVDQSYYRFRAPISQRDWVLDARPWKPEDATARLESVRATLVSASPSPIVSHPHPVFAVQGFHVTADEGSSAPGFRMLTLAYEERVWGLRLAGATSETDLHELLAAVTLPSLIASVPQVYWVALGIAVEARADWAPPREFSYGIDGAILTVKWQGKADFSTPDLGPLIDESDAIRDAPDSAYEVTREVNKIERILRPERLGLGSHCFVAEAVLAAPVAATASVQDAVASHLSIGCTADLRQRPNTPAWWRDLLTIAAIQSRH